MLTFLYSTEYESSSAESSSADGEYVFICGLIPIRGLDELIHPWMIIHPWIENPMDADWFYPWIDDKIRGL